MLKQMPLRVKNSKGFFEKIGFQARLVLRLMADRRVPLLLKVIPLAGLFYWLLPSDFLPFLPFDDALVIWFSTEIFIELCPPEVVSYHRAELEKIVEAHLKPAADQEIIDAEFRVSDDQ